MFDFLKCWCGVHDNATHAHKTPNGTLLYLKCERCEKVNGGGTLNGAVVSEAFVVTVLKQEEYSDLNSWL